MSEPSAKQARPAAGGSLGTFSGVFTPSILTILGLILFLRLGYVVGTAGLPRALLILVIANLISVLTSASLAAIATNFQVKGGGDYYLISRTLGREFGGAIGIVLFLAQSVSIAFYTIGFGEAVGAMVGGDPALPRLLALAALAGLFALSWMGADWATRFQFVIMAILFSGILAFFWGGIELWDRSRLVENLAPAGELPFWVLFAIFFPAVTGFTQGVSMSGDLRDPGRSLPLGTFLAVGLSFVVYLGVTLVFAGALPGDVLSADYGAMRRVSSIPWLIDAGVVAATLSSALASFLGAPRILQSLAKDQVFPILAPFARGAGPTDNPRRGVLAAALIGAAGIGLGKLNVIAPIVTMFFLISYGLLNYATFHEARAMSPSFRPKFRWFDARLSLLGGLGCVAAIVAINPTAGVIAFALLMALHQYLKRTERPDRWADGERAARFQQVREHLLSMSGLLKHARDWRPAILALSDDPERRERLVRFATWIEGRSGITTIVRILVGEGAEIRKQREEQEGALREELARLELQAFARVVVIPDLATGFRALIQAYGVGPIRANTILMNWYAEGRTSSRSPALRAYGVYLRQALRYGCNLVLFESTADKLERFLGKPPGTRRIDVWWTEDATGRLSLLLAYLMGRCPEWKGAEIRVLSASPPTASEEESRRSLESFLEDVRIEATPVIVSEISPEVIRGSSAETDMVFLPFRLKDEEPVSVFGGTLEELLDPLPIAAVVFASEDISLDAGPEEGQYAEIAETLDAATKADENARRAARAAADAHKKVEEMLRALGAAREDGREEKEVAAMEAELERAEGEAVDADRRAAKTRVKAEDARQAAAAITGQPSEEAEAPDPKTPGAP